jgi:hypothetical protein
MNLSIEDLEAIKAIVREVVKEELSRVESPHVAASASAEQQPVQPDEPKQPEPADEVVARIPRM